MNNASHPSSLSAPLFDLVDIRGNKFSLKDFKGKIVFLDFWATWCPPCVISIPEVEKLHNEYKGKPVEFISISVDRDPKIVREFVERHQLSVRVSMSNGIDEKYRVQGIPVFFVIDQEGKIVNAWEGYHSRMVYAWRKELDRLLRV